MAITDLKRDWGIGVNFVRMVSTDPLATVEAAGYLTAQLANTTLLNNGVWEWLASDMVVCYASDGHQIFTLNAALDDLVVYSTAGNGGVTLPVVSGDFTVFDGTLGALKDAGYSASNPAKTKVVMADAAVLVGHLAVYTDTAGTISDDAATAINGGNIQAGLSGTAGFLVSFPSAALKGSLRLTAVANTGDTLVTISNALHGQASVYSIPDGGQATAEFIISDSAGTQHITSGSLAVDLGNITAGSSANAGTFISFPASAANGTFIFSALNAGGAFNTTLRNSVMGQSSVISIPDPGGATAELILKTAPLISGNVVVASGTGGKVVDGGAPVTGLVQVASVAVTAAEFNGMYAAPKLLIAAPGANNLIIIDKIALIMTFVAAAYAAGGVVTFQYDSTVNGAGVAASNAQAAADFFAAASTTFQFEGVSGNTVAIAPFTTSVNKGIYLSNKTGAFTTGDGTWVAKIYYRIISVV